MHDDKSQEIIVRCLVRTPNKTKKEDSYSPLCYNVSPNKSDEF